MGAGACSASGTFCHPTRRDHLSPCLHHLNIQRNLGALRKGGHHLLSAQHPTLSDSVGLGLLGTCKGADGVPTTSLPAARKGLCVSQAAGRLLEEME